MRRLLQFRLLQLGTFLLLAATLLVPLFESFDRWDSPGLGNDTEFHLFAIVLFLALVLLLCRLIVRSALVFRLARVAAALIAALESASHLHADPGFIPPQSSPPIAPLRI